jgi:hypothetical protein
MGVHDEVDEDLLMYIEGNKAYTAFLTSPTCLPASVLIPRLSSSLYIIPLYICILLPSTLLPPLY